MTQILQSTIECSCGNLIDLDLYNSVNMRVNPELRDKVKNRKINNYYCEKCGEENELSHPFLYVDGSQWILCFPEKLRSGKSEAEKQIAKSSDYDYLDTMGINRPKPVFGYGELFEELKNNGKI